MSNDRNELSSDLGVARTIARRLRTRPRVVTERMSGAPAVARYVRFDASRFGVGGGTTTTADRDADSLERWASDLWNRLLDDCLALCSGRDAFLMDDQGLVVSVRGMQDSDALEVLGARLTVTFQQAERIGHREGGASTICVELEDGWLTGLKCPVEGGGPLVVGIIADAPISGDVKAEIVELLGRAVASAR